MLGPLLQAFDDHVISITQAHGIQPIVWEERLMEWNLTLPNTVTVQTWRSSSALNSVLAKGCIALFGSNSHWYLDSGSDSFLDPNLENSDLSVPDREVKPPYLDSCGPFTKRQHIYSYNQLEGISQKHKHLTAGSEVHLWGELTDCITLDGILWPRVAAAAEVMWSGAGNMLTLARHNILLSSGGDSWQGACVQIWYEWSGVSGIKANTRFEFCCALKGR